MPRAHAIPQLKKPGAEALKPTVGEPTTDNSPMSRTILKNVLYVDRVLNNVLAGEFQPFMMHPKTGLGAKLEFRGRCGGGEMATTRRHYSGESKAKVALAAIRGDRTINEVAAEYAVHPAQIMQWKKIAQEELPGIFTERRNGKEEEFKAALYQQTGQLKVELDWVKKSWTGRLSRESQAGGPADVPGAVNASLE